MNWKHNDRDTSSARRGRRVWDVENMVTASNVEIEAMGKEVSKGIMFVT